MTITLLVRWYDRNPNFSANYESPHFGRLYGTPEECMRQFRELQGNHNLSRYTPAEIVGVY